MDPVGQKRNKKVTIPKLIETETNNKIGKMMFNTINRGYALFFIVRKFCKSTLWVMSCFGLMFLFPMMIEYTNEQTKILEKIRANMGDSLMGGPGAGPPQGEMRPF